MTLLPLKDDNSLVNIRFQYMTLILIICCILTFLWQLSLGPEQRGIIYSLGTIPTVLFGAKELSPNLYIIPEPLTVLTSLFLHGGWMHLILNMLFLWVFGDNIEDSIGHLKFVFFYLICGIFAALTHAMVESSSNSPLIGASGAISGVLGAYIILYPKARVLVLFMNIIPLRLPAVLVLGSWIGLQFLSLGNESGTAWWAHIGGFITGMVLIIPFRKNGIALLNRWNISDSGSRKYVPNRGMKKSTTIIPETKSKIYSNTPRNKNKIH